MADLQAAALGGEEVLNPQFDQLKGSEVAMINVREEGQNTTRVPKKRVTKKRRVAFDEVGRLHNRALTCRT